MKLSLILELVQDSMIERERAHALGVADEADFAAIVGNYGEKIQRSIK